MKPELSALFVNYNSWRDCAAAVQSLRAHPPLRADGSAMPYECIVVDNKSPQQPAADIEVLQKALADVARDMGDPDCGRLIMHDENGGYSKGVNLCFRHSRGRWIVVSNPDLLFLPGCVTTLVRHLEQNPRTGCALPKGYWDPERRGQLPPNTLPTLTELAITTAAEFCRPLRRWWSRRMLAFWLRVWQAERPLPLRMMSGCMFVMERDYFTSIGLMDERFPLYYEDSDLSRRIVRSGRQLVQVPEAGIVHYVNRSGQTDLETMWSRHDISRDLYFRKWYGGFGGWLHGLVFRFLRTPRGRRWTRQPPDTPCVELGASMRPPVLRFRHCQRYVMVMALDCRFNLAGGVIGSGDSWMPTAELFRNFGPTSYWMRIHDLTHGRNELIGTWRYDCQKQVGELPPESLVGIDPVAARD